MSVDTTTSADGTTIAHEVTGSGPAIVLVPGVFNDRTRFATLAATLAGSCTVVAYDRRARGESGDASRARTRDDAVRREVEDLDAVIAAVGGAATVLGYSSGALLALAAAARGSSITRLAVYEPPFADRDDARPADLPEQVAALVDADRPGDAVALYQTAGIGLPSEVVAQIRHAPFWPALEALAPSVVYDAIIAQPGVVTVDTLASVGVPTLVCSGAETWPALTGMADAVAAHVPGAERRVLDGGAEHDLDATDLASVLASWVNG